jgi:hypothetical protein
MVGISKHTAAPPSVHPRDQPPARETSDLRPFRVCALDSPRVSRKEDHHHRPLPLFSLPSLTHSLTISPPVAPHRDYYIQPSIPATPKHKRTCILPALPASHLPNSQARFHVLRACTCTESRCNTLLHIYSSLTHIQHTPPSPWLTPLLPRTRPTRCPRGREVCLHCKQHALLQRTHPLTPPLHRHPQELELVPANISRRSHLAYK